MKLHESIKQVWLESTGATTVHLVNTGKHTTATAPQKELTKTVWNANLADYITNMTSAYWGYEVKSKTPATTAEIEALKKADDANSAYMSKATGPQNGSNYRGD